MDAQNERRDAADRRELAVYYRYGNERRNYKDNRRTALFETDSTGSNRRITHAYWGTSGRLVDTTKEIAEAFGLPPESLEMVGHDELISDAEHCQSCAIRDGKYAELEVKLALARKNAERYKNQVEDLLLSIDFSRH
jgi:hypothetical protein